MEIRRDRRPPQHDRTRDLVELVDLVAPGAVEIMIAATYPLYRVTDAFAALQQRRARGEIVLIS
ncbi:zinc-binding dehydrogenase [Streptomyces sp. NPDC058457]|uniref:zinc-binding dehydrogenase n=1 Tax=Streptomyces sp. NPDC058457 TaxID=3346507 RepID=UPI00366044FA